MFDDTKILDAMVKYIKEKKMVPWESGLISSLSARGGLRANGQTYRGINAMLTMMYIEMGGYDSRIFLTHKEIEARGGHVKKGCKAYMVMYALWLWLDEHGNRITEKEAKERKELGLPLEKKWGGYRFYNVFSICDTTLEYDKGEKGVISPAEKIVECEDIVNGWEDCPRISHNLPMMAGASGCYSPGTDTITIPTISCFKTPAFYYGSLYRTPEEAQQEDGQLIRFSLILEGGACGRDRICDAPFTHPDSRGGIHREPCRVREELGV